MSDVKFGDEKSLARVLGYSHDRSAPQRLGVSGIEQRWAPDRAPRSLLGSELELETEVEVWSRRFGGGDCGGGAIAVLRSESISLYLY